MPNVFISYRRKDVKVAERLASEIQSAGHRVWFDEWNIAIGDSIVEQINLGLDGSTYLVLCYSASGISTPWITREWMSTLSRQLNGYAIIILPVILTGGSPPVILDDIRYADLVTDWPKGLSELLDAIR